MGKLYMYRGNVVEILDICRQYGYILFLDMQTNRRRACTIHMSDIFSELIDEDKLRLL